MIAKAKFLIQRCQNEKTQAIISAISLAELLSGTSSEEQMRYYEVINRRFRVVLFDGIAAIQFARMWPQWKERRKQAAESLGIESISREEVKADYMIIATAIAVGANCIYSDDAKLRKFAEGNIQALPLPDSSAPSYPLGMNS